MIASRKPGKTTSPTSRRADERLFEEYVDLMSGVALRNTGRDRGISRLAEDLLKDGGTRIDNFSWNA